MTKEQAREIMKKIVDGETLTRAVADSGMSLSSFYSVMRNDIDLQKEYAWAREMRSETMAEEVIEIADNEPDAAKARNRMDARRWYASKMKPEKYGDKIDLNVHQSVDLLTAIDEAKRRAIPVSFRPIVQELDFKSAETTEEHKQEPLNIFE